VRFISIPDEGTHHLASQTRKTLTSCQITLQSKDSPVFTYTEPKPLLELPEWQLYSSPERTKKLSIAQLLASFNSSNSNDFKYFTGYLARSEDDIKEFMCLMDDIVPASQFAISPEEYNINLWLGSPKVVAQTHFDESPNFNMQVYGTKRWLLSPPEEADKIYTFPYLFPAYRQSQGAANLSHCMILSQELRIVLFSVDFWSKFRNASVIHEMMSEKLPQLTDSELFPKLGQIKAYEVSMQAGEVLFIPAYYFHRYFTYHIYSQSIQAYSFYSVITEDVSIAVNTWSDTAQGNIHQQLTLFPLPFESDWPVSHLSNLIVPFLKQIAEKLPIPPQHDSLYWFQLVYNQYKALYLSISHTKVFADEKAKSANQITPLCIFTCLTNLLAIQQKRATMWTIL